MNAKEKEIIRQTVSESIKNLYVLSVLALGFEETGKLFGEICYPALIESNWIPNQSISIDIKALGQRGKQLFSAFHKQDGVEASDLSKHE